MSYREAEPRDDISPIQPGNHFWVISIVGDIPFFPYSFPVVEAPTAYAAWTKAEMILRSAEIGRSRIVLTLME